MNKLDSDKALEPPHGLPMQEAHAIRSVRGPLILLAILAVTCAVYLGRPLLVPIALSVFAAVLLTPLVDALTRRGVSRLLASACVMTVLAVFLGALVNVTLEPARNWMERAPQILSEVERKLKPLRVAAVQLDKVAKHAERIAGSTAGDAKNAPAAAAAPEPGVLFRLAAFVVPVMGVFFLTFFLLLCSPQILQRLAAGRPNDASARRLLSTVERLRRDMGRYLASLAIINLGLGVATSLLALAFDLPNPVLWGVMAAVFNFIPYVGSATTLVVLSLVALLTHDGLGPVLGVAACYLLLDTIEGQLVQPLLIGRRLALNPLAIFLGLWIGGGLWGVAGVLLATPMLLVLRIVCRHIPRCAVLTDFLAPVGEGPIAWRARAWRRQRRRRARRLRRASNPV